MKENEWRRAVHQLTVSERKEPWTTYFGGGGSASSVFETRSLVSRVWLAPLDRNAAARHFKGTEREVMRVCQGLHILK